MKKYKRVPTPEETPAEIVVSGRTSTLKNIKIACVGDLIPPTFSDNMIKNTPGFTWYVSQHYALKTDFAAKKACEYLTLLEMAYPHYVELFGREIPGIDYRRMACVYGVTRESLIEAMLSDYMHFGYGAGGITQEGFFCAYQSPSNVYHSRYILIHECVHLYEYCLNRRTTEMPGFYVEGVADFLSSHVYEPKKKRLTINVLDRAPIHNFAEYGLTFMKTHPKTNLRNFIDKGPGDRGTNVISTAFLQRTPELAQKWRVYRDEMFRTSHPMKKTEVSLALIQKIFGSWPKLNREFKKWSDSLKCTFHQIDWGFDQHGNALMSFGTPRKARFSQMDINMTPGSAPKKDIYRMDYPSDAVPPIVGPVKRGVAEPSIGCVVDFSSKPKKGIAGIGLGRRGEKHLRVMIDSEKRLIIDGTDIGMKKISAGIPGTVLAAISADGHRVGITAKICRKNLEVTLRAGKGGAKSFTRSVNINKKQRSRLLSDPVCALGRGACHFITPFLDDGRPASPDLMKPASAERWRNPADKYLFAAYKVCYRLGDKTPRILVDIRKKLLLAAEHDFDAQKKVKMEFEEALPRIVKAIYSCGAKQKEINHVLCDMIGLSLSLQFAEKGVTGNKCGVTAVLDGMLFGNAAGEIKFYSKSGRVMPAGRTVRIQAGKRLVIPCVLKNIPKPDEEFYVEAKLNLKWYSVPVSLEAIKTGNEGIPRFLIVGPFDIGAKFEHVPFNEIENAPLNFKRFYSGKCGESIRWQKVEREPDRTVNYEHMVHLVKLFGQANMSTGYALTWVDVPKETKAVLSMGANDGIVVWVNDKNVHTNVRNRDWSPKEDSVKVTLKKGRNKLLFKLLHGGGLWLFSAALSDMQGRPIKGLKTTLECDKP